ncbi:LOW QUALITY PROTEIN: hypothetical protein V2J09_003274 [Rumex salicifolius]
MDFKTKFTVPSCNHGAFYITYRHSTQELKSEGARLRFEAEIGKSPTLNEEETWDEFLELRDERRLDNRSAFANIWSDMYFIVHPVILQSDQNMEQGIETNSTYRAKLNKHAAIAPLMITWKVPTDT